MRDRRELTKPSGDPGSGKSSTEIAREGFERLDKVEPDSYRKERGGLTDPVYPTRW